MRVTTLLEPSAGQAWVNGFDTRTQAPAVRASIGFCSSEDRSFYARLSARQNLTFYGALQEVPWRRLRPRIEELLAWFDLQRAGDLPVQFFSTGMRQKLNVARALLHDPPLLFLVTTKQPTLERKEDLKRRIAEASQFVPLERLALSPQCGFASTEEGNLLTAQDQAAKLRVVGETAREVWG